MTEPAFLRAEAGEWAAGEAAAGEVGPAGAERKEWPAQERASPEPQQHRQAACPSWIRGSASGADNAPTLARTGQSRFVVGKHG